MKIVIADGYQAADYIIGMYNKKGNELIVINQSEEVCKYLSSNHNIPVIQAKSTRESDMRSAGAEDADLFVALSEDDMETYVACKTAKQLLNAKRCIATVMNPKNVPVFRQLGVDSVLSSTYLLGEQIRNAASVENLINTLTLDDNKVTILEIKIAPDVAIRGKSLKDLSISSLGSVSMVIRGEKAIIPNGDTQLFENDRVLIVTTEENRESVVRIFQRKSA